MSKRTDRLVILLFGVLYIIGASTCVVATICLPPHWPGIPLFLVFTLFMALLTSMAIDDGVRWRE